MLETDETTTCTYEWHEEEQERIGACDVCGEWAKK